MRFQSFTSSQRNFVVCQNLLASPVVQPAGTSAAVELMTDAPAEAGQFTLANVVSWAEIQYELFVPDALIFDHLKASWHQEREGVSSSIDDACMCPSYQRIIGMGDKAMPYILRSLEKEGEEPDMWFWALRFITGIDPLLEEDRGDIVAMSKRWLQWAAGKYAW